MKKFIKEIIITLIQLFMFYIFPLFAGPTDAMKNHTNKFVTIKPGYTKKEKIAKEILSRINEDDLLSLDDVVRVLPSGKCDFV